MKLAFKKIHRSRRNRYVIRILLYKMPVRVINSFQLSITLGSKIMWLQMGPCLQLGQVITLVPSTAVGFYLSLSSWNSSFINRPEKGRTAGLLLAPLCSSEIFQKRADWLIIFFLALKCSLPLIFIFFHTNKVGFK